MSFVVRPLNESDYETLSEWWEDWGWDPVEKDFLPDDGKGGIMVLDGDEPVCAGFMYATNSKVAWVNWIVSNMNYRKKPQRKEAIDLLIESLSEICKKSGFKYVFSNNNNKLLIDHFLKSGYATGCNNSTELIKKI